jgi:hypothetical protein
MEAIVAAVPVHVQWRQRTPEQKREYYRAYYKANREKRTKDVANRVKRNRSLFNERKREAAKRKQEAAEPHMVASPTSKLFLISN